MTGSVRWPAVLISRLCWDDPSSLHDPVLAFTDCLLVACLHPSQR